MCFSSNNFRGRANDHILIKDDEGTCINVLWFHVDCNYKFDNNIPLNFCFWDTECYIEWTRWTEALIKHYKAQKKRSNLSFIDSDIHPSEEAQKKNISVLKQLKGLKYKHFLWPKSKHLIHRWLLCYLWNTVLHFLNWVIHLYLCVLLFSLKNWYLWGMKHFD